MNGARRVLLAAYAVVLIAAAVGLVMLAWNSDQQLDISSGSFRLIAHIDGNDAAKWGFTALMTAVVMAAFATLLVALVEPGGAVRPGGQVRVRQPGGHVGTIYADELEEAVLADLERLPEVQSATVEFRMRRGVLESKVAAMIDPAASRRHVTNAISNTVVATLREQVGVEGIAEPAVMLQEGAARPEAGWPEPPPTPAAESVQDDGNAPGGVHRYEDRGD